MNATIGLLSYGLDRSPGGIGRYTRELCDGLRRAGARLTVLQAGRASGDDTVGLPGARLLPGLLTLGQVEIGWLAWRHRLALIHDPTGSAPLLFAGGRRVATIHDVVPYVYPATSTLLDWLIYRLWLPLAVRRLDAIITDSEHSRRDIVRHLPVRPDRVHVVPLAANPSYRPLPADAVDSILTRLGLRRPYLLFVGSLEARKNLPRLLEAYATLRPWSERWSLVVVGARKWKSSSIFQTVARLQLEDRVHFTGFVADADLPALYNGADLFVLPSLYEGYGLPVLEAMACGTPVVTSSCSSLPEVAGGAAVLVDPGSVESIAAGIRQVLGDPARADLLRRLGLAQAARFSWERTARETLAVYERVLL
jgi:glycosyltransferase involved in cell wall biosynthesis